MSSRFPCTSLNLLRSRRNPAFSERYMAIKTIAANPILIMNVRIQLTGRFSPMSANVSPRNSDQQHFPDRVEHKSLFQVDRRRNKSTDNGIEKKRHRHEHDDVDQITQSTWSAHSLRSLELASPHSQEVITSARDLKKNREAER